MHGSGTRRRSIWQPPQSETAKAKGPFAELLRLYAAFKTEAACEMQESHCICHTSNFRTLEARSSNPFSLTINCPPQQHKPQRVFIDKGPLVFGQSCFRLACLVLGYWRSGPPLICTTKGSKGNL